MAITLKRQLDSGEKETILQRYGRNCYANGHVIPDGEAIHFDHIKAFSAGGVTELNNIAPMCQKHNLEKGTLPLEDFRIKLEMNQFFEKGDRLTLKDLLQHLKEAGKIPSFGEEVALIESGNSVKIENHSFSKTFELQQCPLGHLEKPCLTAEKVVK